MKRELKVGAWRSCHASQYGCHKAYPDEKGTESSIRDFLRIVPGFHGHKAYPDEKGTESMRFSFTHLHHILVTRHIPMKRELKAELGIWPPWPKNAVTRHIPMKRELKEVV